MAEANVFLDASFVRRVLHILENRRPVRDGLRLLPRAKRVAERVHVGVGADAGIATQIPCSADVGAALKNRLALVRTARLQAMRRADAGEDRPDDQNVNVFGGHE